MADASGVGAIVDADALPIDPGAREFFAARGLDAVAEAIDGRRRLRAARRRASAHAPASRGGRAPRRRAADAHWRVHAGPRRRAASRRHRETPLARGGYSHFGGGGCAKLA